MIRRYITLIYCSATLSGLFALPTAVVAQEQTMTREERIKSFRAFKDGRRAMGSSNCDADRKKKYLLNLRNWNYLRCRFFLDAVTENATVKRAQSQVEQQKMNIALKSVIGGTIFA